MAAESPGDTPEGRQRSLTVGRIENPLGVVEEEASAHADLEIRALEVLEVIADPDIQARIAVIVHPPRLEIALAKVQPRGGPGPVAVEHPVVVGEFSLEHVPSEVFARGNARPVVHPQRVVFAPEVVLDVGILSLVVHVTDQIARRGVLRRGVEVQHRIERITRTGLQVEGLRTVELPVGYRRRPDRARRERRLQRQRRNRIVDLGADARRVGHIRLDGQFGRASHTRHIGLGHFDLLLDLGRAHPRQRRQQQGGQQQFFHRQFFSFAIRSFASSTIPSSAGEYPSATLW